MIAEKGREKMGFMLSVRDCSGRIGISDASSNWLPALPAIAQHRKLSCAIASRRHHGREIQRVLGYKAADVPRMSVPGANRMELYGGKVRYLTLPLASFALSSDNYTSGIFTVQMDVDHLEYLYKNYV